MGCRLSHCPHRAALDAYDAGPDVELAPPGTIARSRCPSMSWYAGDLAGGSGGKATDRVQEPGRREPATKRCQAVRRQFDVEYVRYAWGSRTPLSIGERPWVGHPSTPCERRPSIYQSANGRSSHTISWQALTVIPMPMRLKHGRRKSCDVCNKLTTGRPIWLTGRKCAGGCASA